MGSLILEGLQLRKHTKFIESAVTPYRIILDCEELGHEHRSKVSRLSAVEMKCVAKKRLGC